MKKTMHDSGLPFRMAETNSCYQGGKQGVSDTFASALWGGDLMYQLATAGGAGINFHGGGYGWYTPIAGTPEKGFTARPIYSGMLLFADSVGGQLVEAKLDSQAAPLLTAYGLRSDAGHIQVAAFNKHTDRIVRLIIDPGQRAYRVTVLYMLAPRIDATTGIRLGGGPLALENGSAALELPAASAALVTFYPG